MPAFEILSESDGKKVFASARQEWPSASDMPALKKAVEAKAKSVTLSDGNYHITYGYRHTYPVSKETIDSVRLNRLDPGFTPMGYIPIKRIMAA